MRIASTIILAFSLAGFALAADLQFSASVDQTTVGMGEQLTLTVSVQGEDLSAPRPELPSLPDFQVLGSSSSQSTNIQFINGSLKKQSSINFVYYLSPKKLGKLTIGPCKLGYQGKTYQSQPIEINAVKASAGAPRPGQPQPSSPQPSQARVPVEGNLFLSASANRRTVYQGEQVNVEYALYNRFQISGLDMAEMPTFGGFWSEKLFDVQKLSFTQRVVDGKAYQVALLKKVALFPMTTGTLTVKPMALNVGVVQQSQDFFDFFGVTKQVRVESKPLAITVQPLPGEGRPAEFTGGVGTFTIKAALDRTASANGEPFNLTVTVAGTGNVRLIEKPALPAIPGLKMLDPEVKDDINPSGDVIRGSKTFRYPVLPQSDGKYLIPPIRMAFFNPQFKAYQTVQTAQLECTATGCVPGAVMTGSSGIKVMGSDISYIKPDAKALSAMAADPSPWLNLVYAASLLAAALSVWLRFHQDRLATDRGYARRVRSSGLVKKRLKQAEHFLKKKDSAQFYASLSQSIIGYIGDRFNLETQAMTKDQLAAEMARLGVGQEISGGIVQAIGQCEVARFSPGLVADKDPGDLFERVKQLLNAL